MIRLLTHNIVSIEYGLQLLHMGYVIAVQSLIYHNTALSYYNE